MKSLIVNADDLGLDAVRNAAIVKAHREGIVTAVSVLVNLGGFESVLRENPGLDPGLHLNLSEGRPLVSGHRTLVGADGLFFGKEESRRRAAGFAPEEVEREAEAQLARLPQATHIDGHQHLHIYGIAAAVARVAKRAGIRWIRRPDDVLGHNPRVNEYRRLSTESDFGDLRSPSFTGSAISGAVNAEVLLETLRRLPEGVTELMVHPGYREELAALTDPRVRGALETHGIQLTRFRDL